MCFMVDFKQNFEFLPSPYTTIDFGIQTWQKVDILLKINPNTRYFFMKFCSVVYKYILNHIVRRNYACTLKLYFYRLIFCANKLILGIRTWQKVDILLKINP